MSYQIVTTVEPVSECVTTDQLKAYLRLNTTDEDSLLLGFVTSARQCFENLTNRVILATTFRQYNSNLQQIYLYRGQVTSIIDWKYFDNTDALQVISTFNQDINGIPGKVWIPFSAYPQSSLNLSPTNYVDFVAGYSTVDAVPKLIQTAIMMLAAHFWANREATTTLNLKDLPLGFKAVCDQYRTGIVGEWDKKEWNNLYPWRFVL